MSFKAGGCMVELTVDYRNNDKLRNSLCDLAGTTFGIDLASWYEAGFWQGDYPRRMPRNSSGNRGYIILHSSELS